MSTDSENPSFTTDQELIQEEGKIPVIIVAPYGPSFIDLIKILAADPAIQLVQCSSSFEVVPYAREFLSCVIVFHALEVRDVVKHATMLKFLQEGIRSSQIRAIFTSYIQQPILLKKLMFLGCHEILPEPTSAKKLAFKIDRHVKILQVLARVQEVSSDSIAGWQGRGAQSGPAARGDENGSQFRFAEPLEFESDFWYLAPGHPKRIGLRWLVQVNGPATHVGHWEPLGESTEESREWIWKVDQKIRHPFVAKGGAWVFKGQQPLFKKDLWWFVGTALELVFHQDGAKAGSKVFVDSSGVLVLRRNSQFAERALPLFQVQSSRVPAFSKSESLKKGGLPFRRVPPLLIPNDLWFLEDRSPKLVNQHWTLRLKGPYAAQGNWIEDKKLEESQKVWKWVPHEQFTAEGMRPEKGFWEFSGLQPKFEMIDEKGFWLFVSQKPRLSFVGVDQTPQNSGDKLAVDSEGILLIASDAESSPAVDFRSVRFEKSSVNLKQIDSIPVGTVLPGIEAHEFGNPPGRWRKVTPSKNNQYSYIYIPFDNVNELKSAIPMMQQKQFWVFHGPEDPKLISEGKKFWVFGKGNPEKISNFNDLPQNIQAYLTQLEQKEIEITPEARKKAFLNFRKNFSANPPNERLLDLKLTQPQLSPLGLSFLMSELAFKSASKMNELALFYCKFVSGAFDGVRTELWVCRQNEWTCVNTFDGSEGQFGSSFGKVEFFPQLTPQGTLVAPIIGKLEPSNETLKEGPLESSEASESPDAEDTILGALVMGGPGLEKISIDTTQGYSLMARGLIQSFF